MGYDFDFITFKKSNQKSWIFYENDSNKARWIEKPRLRLFRYGVNFEILHKDFLNQYDLIISQEYYQIMTYLLSRKTSNLVLYSGPYWNLFMTKIGSIFYDFLFSKSINTNVKCKFVKSDLAKQFLENKGYTDLISIGVGLDFDRFDNCIYMQEETKAVVDFMNKNNCILYVGGIDENKNYPFLLQVYAEILNVRPDVKLVIIGKSKQSWKQKLLGKKNESYELACNKNFDNRVIDGIYRVKRIDNSQLKFIYPLAKSLLLPSSIK